MANYAYVENEQIVGVYDQYPQNWKNISNFPVFAENYPEQLESLGWYTLIHIIPQFDSNTQKIEFDSHYFENGNAYEKYIVVDIPLPPPPEPGPDPYELQWNNVRSARDHLMSDFEWRYERYDRQTRLNLPLSDNLQNMDLYMQALADITLQPDPFNITWPIYSSS